MSRAIRDDYEHVTSTTTLLKLAAAAKAKLPTSQMITEGLPSEASLTEVLGQILSVAVPDRAIAPDVLRGLAGALRDTLGLLAVEQGGVPDPGTIRAVARTTALLQFRPDESS